MRLSEHQARMLAVLAELPSGQMMGKWKLSVQSGFDVTWLPDALKPLAAAGYVEWRTVYGQDCVRATAAGRAALAEWEAS